MRNLKKILALVLALMMVLSVMVTASAADFVDANEIEHTEAVNVMAGLGILAGNPTADGEFAFNPNGILNRGEAAKIIAYIVTGDADYVVDVAQYMEHPFTDVVGHWAEPYVAYCYDAGLIAGQSATTYGVKANLKGFDFAKLLLCAAGINTNENYVAADSYTVEVYKDLKTNKLLTGLADVKWNEAITRQDACQLAWNVMNWSPAGETVEYIVKDGDTVVYQGTDSLTSALIKNAIAGATMTTKVTSVGSLADNIFGLTYDADTDAFGRVTKVYTSALLPKMKVTLSNDVDPITFVAAAPIATDALVAGINTNLGLTGDKALVAATGINMIVNGDDVDENIVVGDTVEVYLDADGKIAKVIVIHEELVVANCPDTAETTGPNAGKYAWTFGASTVHAAKDAYKDDAYYLVIAKNDNTALVINKPAVITNQKIVKANVQNLADATYMYVGEEKLVKGGIYNTALTLNYTTGYDFIKNSNGYLVKVVAGTTASVEVELEKGYAWLLQAEKQITTNSVGASLIGGTGSYAWDVVAKAELVIPGETIVVDLTTNVTKNSAGVVTGLKINGVTMTDVLNDTTPENIVGTVVPAAGWVEYTIQEDGTYTLAAISMKNAYIYKDQADIAVDGGKIATSSTEWTNYRYDPATKTMTAETKVGIANFGSFRTDMVYKTSNTNANVITVLDTFYVIPAAVEKTTYAYYAGTGDYVGSAASHTYKFYVDGEVKEYFALGTAMDAATAGSVYELTFDTTTGKVSAISTEAYTTFGGADTFTVVMVDETFFVVSYNNGANTKTVYFDEDYACYNVSTGHNGEADGIAVGDTVKLISEYSSYRDWVYVAYIVAEAR